MRQSTQESYVQCVAVVIGLCVLFVDQLSKDLACSIWYDGGPTLGVVRLAMSKNFGLAMGVGEGIEDSLRIPMLLGISFVSLLGILILSRLVHGHERHRLLALSLLSAGAIGNAIDRVFRGYVVDFIEMNAGGGVSLNLADVSITIGVLYLAVCLFRRGESRTMGGRMESMVLSTEEVVEVKKRRAALAKMSPGTTLVEILIVVAIIGLVLGAVAIGVVPLFQKGQKGIAWNDTKNIEGMYTAWKATHTEDNCPESVEALQKAAGKKGQDLKDPWGTSYEITCPSGHDLDIDVFSAGPDKKTGTDDDIGNWMPQPKE